VSMRLINVYYHYSGGGGGGGGGGGVRELYCAYM
jgi:hypothetical protein